MGGEGGVGSQLIALQYVHAHPLGVLECGT